MSTKPYDQAFKYLAEQDAESLLILLGILQPGEPAEIEKLPLELSVSTILADQPYRVKTADYESIAHIEAQTKWEDDILQRMPNYGSRLWMNYQLPIISYVLMLTKRGLPKPLPRVARIEAGSIEIKAKLKIVKLWEMPAKRILAMKRQSLLPFVPLMKGNKQDLEASAQLLRAVKDEQKQRDLGIHFVMLGGLRYNREDLLELIVERGMIPFEKFRDSSFYQYILEEGEKKGREEGREEGEVEGVANTLLKLVAKRFPNLEVTAEVKRIEDFAVLQQLCVDLLDMQDADALRKRLAEILK